MRSMRAALFATLCLAVLALGGCNTGKGYLPSFVDEEMIERLLELRPREKPSGSRYQLVLTTDSLIVCHVLDELAVEAFVLAA